MLNMYIRKTNKFVKYHFNRLVTVRNDFLFSVNKKENNSEINISTDNNEIFKILGFIVVIMIIIAVLMTITLK
jgi:hypothetical protein